MKTLYTLKVDKDSGNLMYVVKKKDTVSDDFIKEVKKKKYRIQFFECNLTDEEFGMRVFSCPKPMLSARCYDRKGKLMFEAYYNFWESTQVGHPIMRCDLYDGKVHITSGTVTLDNPDSYCAALSKLEELVVDHASEKLKPVK